MLHFKIENFATIWLISLENQSDLNDNFDRDGSLDKKMPVKF